MTDNYKKVVKDKTPLILIVDDVPENLRVLGSMLNTEGYEISFASGGEKALEITQKVTPDLILLDIMMPDMDGYEVARRLKQEERTKDIPIIYLTGKADTDDVIKGLSIGAVDYVTKPFDASELLARVKTHLELKFSRDAIEDYSIKLEKSEKECRVMNDSKDKFFSILAHDLRGPFSGFLGLSELLTEEYDRMEKEDVVKIGSSLNKSAKRLFSLLENLLNWSRIQMGRMEFSPTKLELKNAIVEVVNLYMQTAEVKKIDLKYKVEDGTLVNADKEALNVILRNLISNAVKFTPEGGEINVVAEIFDEDKYKVSVEDSGVGMDEEAKSKLFRLDEKHSTLGTNNEQGSGLGLLLCKELVEKHGGKLSVESQVNKGTKFTFTLEKAK